MIDRFDYLETQSDAEEIIQEFGFITAVLSKKAIKMVTNPTPPPETIPETLAFDEKPTGTEVEHSINCVRLPLSRTDKDNLIKAGYAKIEKYIKVIISAKGLSVEPVISDTIELTDHNYKIFQIKPVKPTEIAIIYSCYCEQI